MKYKALNAFKGFTILWIIYLHTLAHPELYGTFLERFFKRGYLGVGIFFVISGFGISAAAETVRSGWTSAFDFIKRRLKRIYIPYWFSLFFVGVLIPVAIGYLSFFKMMVMRESPLLKFEFYRYAFSEWIYLITLTKIFTIHSWNFIDAFYPINIVVWFIGVIVQIYLTIFLALIHKKYYHHVLFCITGISFLTFVPRFEVYFPQGLFLPCWPEFALGLGLYELVSRGAVIKFNQKAGRIWLISVIILLLILLMAIIQSNIPQIWFSFIFTLLLWFIYPIDNQISRTKFFRFVVFLSTFSYSLLLMHVPLKRLIDLFLHNMGPISVEWADLLLAVPIIVISSYFWARLFEKPFHKMVTNTV